MIRRLHKIVALTALLMVSLGRGSSAEQLKVDGRIFAFHEKELKEIAAQYKLDIRPTPAVSDAEFLVELVGIPNFAKINALKLQIIRAYGLHNAFALRPDDHSTILYDPDWAQARPAEFYLILGHEAGHLFCGHSRIDSQTELEADRFSGASIKRFEIYHGRQFISDVLAAASNKYSNEGGVDHPPRTQRIAAIKKGYEQGSPCGDLAPVDQGPFGTRR